MPPSLHPNIEALAEQLRELAIWEEIQQTPFKPRAYQLAAESVEALGSEVFATWQRGGISALVGLPGIGRSIASKIDEYFRTGTIAVRERMREKFPVDIEHLGRIEGLGPRHLFDLYTRLGIRTIADLKHALDRRLVRTMPGWGERSEAKVARALELMEQSKGRYLLGHILPIADEIVAALSAVKGVRHCVYAGSLRRRQETIGDIDLIATATDAEVAMDAFVALPLVQTVHEHGKTRSSVRLRIGIDADLRVVSPEVFGATLQYFTGDRRHNILLREYAKKKGFILNEYGLFRVRAGKVAAKPLACKTEADVYRRLGMDLPPPEIRVGGEEIDAALQRRLPKLVPYGSVRGDLQIQTNWTDGAASMKEMALAAKRIGLRYIAITDHTKSLAFVNGLNDARVLEQGQAIDALNRERLGIMILKGTECDVHRDGGLDLSRETRKTLEWVGIAIHSHFQLSRREQTARLVAAMAQPFVECVFHPTGRIIGKRAELDVDMEEVIAAAKRHRVALEIDAFPERSDLRDIYVRMAVRAGVKLVIDSDAHAPAHFGYLPLGEAIARRGWAAKNDILNTKPLAELRAYLAKKRQKMSS